MKNHHIESPQNPKCETSEKSKTLYIKVKVSFFVKCNVLT